MVAFAGAFARDRLPPLATAFSGRPAHTAPAVAAGRRAKRPASRTSADGAQWERHRRATPSEPRAGLGLDDRVVSFRGLGDQICDQDAMPCGGTKWKR